MHASARDGRLRQSAGPGEAAHRVSLDHHIEVEVQAHRLRDRLCPGDVFSVVRRTGSYIDPDHAIVRRAQRLLESTDWPIDRIAAESGLGSASNLRIRFADIVGTSPTRYRSALTATALGRSPQ